MTHLGWGFARLTLGAEGQTIAAAIPQLHWNGAEEESLHKALGILGEKFANDEFVARLTTTHIAELRHHLTGAAGSVMHHMKDGVFALVVLFGDLPCKSVESVYAKLLAMSEGFAKPRTLNLTGIFSILPNLAWSGNRPYELPWLRTHKTELQMAGTYPHIDYVDKIPRFLHHVIPADNTRLLDGAKVRLGAHVAAGTTLMPGASYINFNAGTLGPSMVEGRISSSATIGPGTDVGGGASILGVLSGGNATPIEIGGTCLLGANSVCGIPLGDGCIIDAGVTVLAGSKVNIGATELVKLNEVNKRQLPGYKDVFKGSELAGLNGLHFRMDSEHGTLRAFRSTREIKLNESLHR